ncbi:MAG TPA: signal peptidase I [Anaeromyxobacter sp.]|nr:signal peptidase I [Anaeromyxobacter sp.]
MGDPVRKLERARRDAGRFAADARRLAGRQRKKLAKKAREEIEAAAAEVDAAAKDGDPDRLSLALHALDALWSDHLAARSKPLWREYGETMLLAAALALAVRAFVVEPYRVPSGSMAPTLLAGDHVFVSRLAYAVRIPFTRLRLLELGVPRRGDVVVFQSPRDPAVDLVKRVVGVPGDVVELREQVLHVNGVPQPRTASGEIAYEERSEETGAPFLDTCRRYRESLAKGELVEPEGTDEGAAEARWQAAAAAGVASYDVMQCRRARLSSREGPYEVVRPGHVFVLGDNRDRSADGRSAGGWQVPLGNVHGRVERVFWSWGLRGGGTREGAGLRLERLFKPVE